MGVVRCDDRPLAAPIQAVWWFSPSPWCGSITRPLREWRSMPLREFAEFTDADDLVWKVDISFLTSSWGCIFGQGCPGVYPAGSGKSSVDGGCCTHAGYLEDADDVK